MSSELKLDKTKRTTPCNPDCRHPICVRLKNLEEEKKILKELDYFLEKDELNF